MAKKGAGEHDIYMHPTWGDIADRWGVMSKALAMSNMFRKGRGGHLDEEVVPRP